MLKLRRHTVNDIDYQVPTGNGHRAAGAEVVLYVYDYEYVFRGDLHEFPSASCAWD
ncbi:MAG: hypothetical protein ACLP7O_10045 [Terracidiphilus sp.]